MKAMGWRKTRRRLETENDALRADLVRAEATIARQDHELDQAWRRVDVLERVEAKHERLGQAVLFAVDLASDALGIPPNGPAVGDDQQLLLVEGEQGRGADGGFHGVHLSVIRAG